MQEEHNEGTALQTVSPKKESGTVDKSCKICQSIQAEAAWSDAHKADLLLKLACLDQSELDPEAAIDLAIRLKPDFKDFAPVCDVTAESPASSCSTAVKQQTLLASLDEIFKKIDEQAYMFRIYPRGWAVDFENLWQFNAPEKLKVLGSTFDRIGLDGEHGALMGFFGGEYDPTRNLCRFSLSGIASRGPAKLLSKLGSFPLFRDFPPGNAYWVEDFGDPFISRVSVTKVHGPAHHQAELYQQRWPLCPTVLNAEFKYDRLVDHRGLPELAEAKILYFLDQWKLSDLTLLVGLVDGELGLGCVSSFNGS